MEEILTINVGQLARNKILALRGSVFKLSFNGDKIPLIFDINASRNNNTV